MEVAPSQMEVVPSKMEVASSKIEVSPFFVDFHDLRTFVAIYILSQFTHFFRQFFLAKIAFSATSHVFCMYDYDQFGNAAKLVEKGVEIREASEQENCKSHYFAKRCLY